jgi:hypothetical protein
MVAEAAIDGRMAARLKLTPYKLLLAALFVYATLFIGFKSRPMDFGVYYHAAEKLRTGEDIYAFMPEGAFSYPPFAAWIFTPLTLASRATPDLPIPRAAQWCWAVLQGMSLVLVVHFAVCLSRRQWEALTRTQRVWLIGIVIFMSARHLAAPLESSQTDLMITAMCLGAVLMLRSERAQRWSGAPLAAAVGMKAAPLLFLPFLARWRRWQAALVMCVAVGVLNVLPSLQFPGATGRWHVLLWIDSMAKPAVEAGPAADRRGVWRADEEYNQSLGGTLSRLFIKGCYSANALLVQLSQRSMKIIFVVMALALLGCAVFVRRGRWYGVTSPPLTPDGYDAAVVMALLLLFSPKTSKAHYCSMLLPIILITANAVRRPKQWSSILWFIVGGAMGLLTKGVVGSKTCNTLLDYGYFVWFAVIVLVYLWFTRDTDDAMVSPARSS